MSNVSNVFHVARLKENKTRGLNQGNALHKVYKSPTNKTAVVMHVKSLLTIISEEIRNK